MSKSSFISGQPFSGRESRKNSKRRNSFAAEGFLPIHSRTCPPTAAKSAARTFSGCGLDWFDLRSNRGNSAAVMLKYSVFWGPILRTLRCEFDRGKCFRSISWVIPATNRAVASPRPLESVCSSSTAINNSGDERRFAGQFRTPFPPTITPRVGSCGLLRQTRSGYASKSNSVVSSVDAPYVRDAVPTYEIKRKRLSRALRQPGKPKTNPPARLNSQFCGVPNFQRDRCEIVYPNHQNIAAVISGLT